MRASPSSGASRSAVPSVLALSTTRISHGRPARPSRRASRAERGRDARRLVVGGHDDGQPGAAARAAVVRCPAAGRLARSWRAPAASAAGPLGPAACAARRALTGPAAFAPTCHAAGRARRPLRAARAAARCISRRCPRATSSLGLYRDMADAALPRRGGRAAARPRGGLLALIERHVAPGRLLEVGCGHGLLLDEARRRGWAVTGLEPSAAARAARARRARARRPARAARGARRPPRSRASTRSSSPTCSSTSRTRSARCGACAALLAPGGALLRGHAGPVARRPRALAGARWWGFLPGPHVPAPAPHAARAARARGARARRRRRPAADVLARLLGGGLGERVGRLGGAAARADGGRDAGSALQRRAPRHALARRRARDRRAPGRGLSARAAVGRPARRRQRRRGARGPRRHAAARPRLGRDHDALSRPRRATGASRSRFSLCELVRRARRRRADDDRRARARPRPGARAAVLGSALALRAWLAAAAVGVADRARRSSCPTTATSGVAVLIACVPLALGLAD